MISKDDHTRWKYDEVTEAYMEACSTRLNDAKEILINQAGLDQDQDNFYRGFIHAYREMLNFTFEDFEE
jgi:hypothetical protein